MGYINLYCIVNYILDVKKKKEEELLCGII